MSMNGKAREKRLKAFGDHQKFLQRITKTLYYGTLPKTNCLSLPVTELAAELFSQPQHGRSLDRLHCNDAAKISRSASVSPCSLVLAMLYLERLKLANPDYLQQAAPSELFLVSLMVSSKFLYDDGEEDQVFIKKWAISGGISIKRLVLLEKEFLAAIHWDVYVNDNTFWERLVELEKNIAKKEGCSRGWFTYTELQNLLTMININDLFQYLAALSAVFVATYTVGLLTIASAVFIVSNVPGNCLTPSTGNTKDSLQVYLAIDNQNDLQSSIDIESDLFAFDHATNNRQMSKPLDAADVLKTGILLASIKASYPEQQSNSHEIGKDSNAEFISWDWWNNSTMTWLAQSSDVIQTFTYIPDFKCFIYYRYQEKCIASCKMLDLEVQVHEATKTRIQDQIERSWHKEWTDVFKSLSFRRETHIELM